MYEYHDPILWLSTLGVSSRLGGRFLAFYCFVYPSLLLLVPLLRDSTWRFLPRVRVDTLVFTVLVSSIGPVSPPSFYWSTDE